MYGFGAGVVPWRAPASPLGRNRSGTDDVADSSTEESSSDDGFHDPGELNSRGWSVGIGNLDVEAEGDVSDGSDEFLPDNEWDTLDWDRAEVQAATATLVNEIEGCKIHERKRRNLATGMLTHILHEHEAAADYIDGGMERFVDRALRMECHGQDLACRNLCHMLSHAASVPSLADKMARLGAVVKAAACLNERMAAAALVVQSSWRLHRYISKGQWEKPAAVRGRQKMLNIVRVSDHKRKFRAMMGNTDRAPGTPGGVHLGDDLRCGLVRLLHNMVDKDVCLNMWQQNRGHVLRTGAIIGVLDAMSSHRRVVRRRMTAMLHTCAEDANLRAVMLRSGCIHFLKHLLVSTVRPDRMDALELLDILAQNTFRHENGQTATLLDANEGLRNKESKGGDTGGEGGGGGGGGDGGGGGGGGRESMNWRQKCWRCGYHCGITCKRPHFEAGEWMSDIGLVQQLLRMLWSRDTSERLGYVFVDGSICSLPASCFVVE
jgi:uncharacterized membrane protein YgcG